MKEGTRKKVLVFGTFDGLHDGHRFFLREARKYGGLLIAVIAQDAVVKELKGRPPSKPLKERLAALCAARLADEVIAGDEHINSWKVLAAYSPDAVCIGYDQTALAAALADHIKNHNLSVTLATLPPHRPDCLHSSLLP